MLFVDASQSIGMIAPTWIGSLDELDAVLWSFLLLLLAPIAAGLVLWNKAEWICGAIPESLSLPQSDTLTAEDLLLIGAVALGLYTLVFGIVSLAYTEGKLWPPFVDEFATEETMNLIRTTDFAARASYIVQIGLGLVLILGRKSIAKLAIRD